MEETTPHGLSAEDSTAGRTIERAFRTPAGHRKRNSRRRRHQHFRQAMRDRTDLGDVAEFPIDLLLAFPHNTAVVPVMLALCAHATAGDGRTTPPLLMQEVAVLGRTSPEATERAVAWLHGNGWVRMARDTDGRLTFDTSPAWERAA